MTGIYQELTPTRRVLLFFALAFGISWSVWFAMRAAAIRPTLGPNFSTSPGYLLLAFGIAGPTWAALLVTYLALGQEDRRDLIRRFLRWRVSRRWYLIALGMPLFLALIATLLYTLAGGSGFVVEFWPLIGLVPQFLWTIILGGPLEEELGWRGFAFPRVQARTNALESSLIIGVVWGLWHTPLFLLPGTTQYELVVLTDILGAHSTSRARLHPRLAEVAVTYYGGFTDSQGSDPPMMLG